MADLDATAQKLLNKDPNNPNSPKKADVAAAPAKGLSRSAMTASKPSLRETMLAQKRALAAKNLPARPGSAMAHISSARTTSTTPSQANTSASSTDKPTITRTRAEPKMSGNSAGMSGAPMRPARRRPEVAARPATAGPYSARDQPSSMEIESPDTLKAKGAASKLKSTTPRRVAPRPRPGHAPHASEPSVVSPAGASGRKPAGSPRITPAKLKQAHTAHASSTPSKMHEDVTLTVPTLSSMASPSASAAKSSPHAGATEHNAVREASVSASQVSSPAQPAAAQDVPEMSLEPQSETPSRTLKIYEDPFTDAQSTPKPNIIVPVLEEKPVNEDVSNLQRSHGQPPTSDEPESPEKVRQNSRLLDSGINKIKAKLLEVHGFRKLQSLIRDSKTVFTDDKFEALLVGLFQYLEDPMVGTAADKAQDVKAQILATIKLLLKKERENFQPHVSKGLESLLQTRGSYDSRAHVVSGLELLADELVTIGDGSEIVVVLTHRLQSCPDTTAEGCRTLSMGLHVLKEMLDRRTEFVPTPNELTRLANLAGRCLDSADSGVRMDAVKFCVALHARVGETDFWNAVHGIKDDPKSLITYYIVKRQREQSTAGA